MVTTRSRNPTSPTAKFYESSTNGTPAILQASSKSADLSVSSISNHSKTLQSLFLAIAVFGGLAYTYPDRAKSVANPFQLSISEYFKFYTIKTGLLILLDFIITACCQCCKPKRLLFREENPNVKGLQQMENIDYIFLVVNSFIEYTYLMNLGSYVVTDGLFMVGWKQASITNTICAFFALFVAADFFYSLAHRFMHLSLVYPWVHKHHHRQMLPKRGYLDAGNEHPIEQMVGFATLWLGTQVVIHSLGVHLVAGIAHFAMYGVLAILNHSEFDIRFHICRIPLFYYSVGAHEMHHRNPKCNMAQSFMLWDKLMGTFKDYTPTPKGS